MNGYHEDVMMGGDSACLAPEVYYMRVRAKMIQGATEDDGYGLIFEEIGDECNGLLRVREKSCKASVVQCFFPGDKFNIYINQQPTPAIRLKGENKLAVLAIYDEHWFYVNDSLIGQAVIPRWPMARLDVGIIAGSQQHVICQFQDFRVYVPLTAEYPGSF